jgi:hypothetical protein
VKASPVSNSWRRERAEGWGAALGNRGLGGGRYNNDSAGGGPWRRPAGGGASERGALQVRERDESGNGRMGVAVVDGNRGGRRALAVSAGPSACSVYRLGPEESNNQWNPSSRKKTLAFKTDRSYVCCSLNSPTSIGFKKFHQFIYLKLPEISASWESRRNRTIELSKICYHT